jgi:hypothetical protein
MARDEQKGDRNGDNRDDQAQELDQHKHAGIRARAFAQSHRFNQPPRNRAVIGRHRVQLAHAVDAIHQKMRHRDKGAKRDQAGRPACHMGKDLGRESPANPQPDDRHESHP